MNVLVLSDLHLGSPLFNKTKEIMDLIRSDKYGSIILNGDILDGLLSGTSDILDELTDGIGDVFDLF